MKQLIKELSLSGLTLKQKAIVWYFVIHTALSNKSIFSEKSFLF